MERVTELVAAKVTEVTKGRIAELAEQRYDGNISMTTRRIIKLGLVALEREQRKRQAA